MIANWGLRRWLLASLQVMCQWVCLLLSYPCSVRAGTSGILFTAVSQCLLQCLAHVDVSINFWVRVKLRNDYPLHPLIYALALSTCINVWSAIDRYEDSRYLFRQEQLLDTLPHPLAHQGTRLLWTSLDVTTNVLKWE